MKISLNWLKQFTDIDISAGELVEKIGAQLGAVEEVINLGQKYQGVVIARVVSCEKHPNADKLSVCWVDDGGVTEGVERNEAGNVQVVCGASNVRAGMSVAWLPPGVTVPSTFDKDPFVLGTRELRGIVSNGMLASASELAIGDDHSGIVEIDIEAAPGTPFGDVYGLNDTIIDIENKMFTHRPDCFGILGVAREVAGIQHIRFTSPEWYQQALDRIKPGASRLPLDIRNEAPDVVPRLMAVAMADVTVGPSPFIMQTYLSRVGIRPINNIVDITNYLMVLTGQPLHAYDYDKVASFSGDIPTLIARLASENGEDIALLNGKTATVHKPAIVIATDKVAIGVGGVMGGAETEVDQHTKNIIIECANFNMYSIRKTSMRYGLFTDAVTRFNKGQSPLQNDRILEEAVAMVQSIATAHVASKVFDEYEAQSLSEPVSVTTQFINERLGLQLTTESVTQLLTNVEFDVTEEADSLFVRPPFWRTDIAIAEDIVEEVGRLYGFDYLPQELPLRSITPARRDDMLSLKSSIRASLSKAGANEVLTYSFVHGNLLDRVGQKRDYAHKLSNALSPDLQYCRLSLTPSLLEKVHPNIKAGYDEFAIFEMNKVSNKVRKDDNEQSLPKEYTNLAFVYAANDKVSRTRQGAAYYMAQKYLTTMLTELGITVTFMPFAGDGTHAGSQPFDTTRTATVKISGTDEVLGIVGEYRDEVARSLKLPKYVAGFEIDLQKINTRQTQRTAYRPLSRYPKVEQDMTIRVRSDVAYESVRQGLVDSLKDDAPDTALADVQLIGIYEKDADYRNYTFRFTTASHLRTMTTEEVNASLDRAADSLRASIGAERI